MPSSWPGRLSISTTGGYLRVIVFVTLAFSVNLRVFRITLAKTE